MSSDQALGKLQRQAIRHWAECGRSLTQRVEAFEELTGCDYEAPLLKAIWGERDAHTNAITALIEDEGEWLAWFEHECHFGATPRAVSFQDGSSILVDSVDKLIEVIERDRCSTATAEREAA